MTELILIIGFIAVMIGFVVVGVFLTDIKDELVSFKNRPRFETVMCKPMSNHLKKHKETDRRYKDEVLFDFNRNDHYTCGMFFDDMMEAAKDLSVEQRLNVLERVCGKDARDVVEKVIMKGCDEE